MIDRKSTDEFPDLLAHHGFGIAEFQEVGELIVEVLDALSRNGAEEDASTEAAVREKVTRLVRRFPIYNA